MRLTGLGVSPGIGVGKALLLKRGAPELRFRVPTSMVPREIERLTRARERSREQLQQIRDRIARSAGTEHAYMFDAQLLMLDDAMLIDRAVEIIRSEQLNAGSAVERAFREIAALFDRADDAYLRERQGDVGDVVGRLCMNLRTARHSLEFFRNLEGPLVLVADELTPSTVAQLDWQCFAAFVTDAGSWTYHTAILARSMHIPAVAGLRNASQVITPGMLLAVDGATGDVFIDPDPTVLEQLRARQEQRAELEHALDQYRRLPAVTEDGVRIRLEANVESPDDARRARESGAEGVGLFRSEFLLAGRGQEALGEDAQFEAYTRLVQSMAPGRVTVRTFDVSEAQLPADVPVPDGARAPLGLRGIRLSLAREDMFQAQLRALLRAASHGPLRIMFPFVSGVEELRAARAAVQRAAETLRARGDQVPPVPVGVMIEVPSAAVTADLLADDADFFSIGTNDLIQYYLAVDRTDDKVSDLYQPLHPAIVRTLRLVARAARRRSIPLAVCGEMAAEPTVLPLLVGLGVTEFSMAPTAIPLANQALRGLRARDAETLAARTLRARTAAEIEELLTTFIAARNSNALKF